MAVACDAQSLVAAAQCIACGIPPGMQFPVLASLLCQIANNGAGGGGSGQVLQGNADPVSAPANPASPALYTNLTSGILFTWNVSTQQWQ